MTGLTLYHTSGCHLCEEAVALTQACMAAKGMKLDCLDLEEISEDADLLERYGLLIPVLRIADTEQELNWPFGLPEIQHFLNGCV